jgi:hypothetical protein
MATDRTDYYKERFDNYIEIPDDHTDFTLVIGIRGSLKTEYQLIIPKQKLAAAREAGIVPLPDSGIFIPEPPLIDSSTTGAYVLDGLFKDLEDCGFPMSRVTQLMARDYVSRALGYTPLAKGNA